MCDFVLYALSCWLLCYGCLAFENVAFWTSGNVCECVLLRLNPNTHTQHTAHRISEFERIQVEGANKRKSIALNRNVLCMWLVKWNTFDVLHLNLVYACFCTQKHSKSRKPQCLLCMCECVCVRAGDYHFGPAGSVNSIWLSGIWSESRSNRNIWDYWSRGRNVQIDMIIDLFDWEWKRKRIRDSLRESERERERALYQFN